MRKSVQAVMLAACVSLSFSATTGFAKDRSNKNGVDAGVSVSLGGKKGLDVDVDASIGGRKGINANVDANVGGRKGLNANVDARVGNRRGINANVDVSIGGRKGLNADVDASIGGKKGLNVGVDVGLGIDDGKPNTRPDVTDRGLNDEPSGALTSAQRQAFNEMSSGERNTLIKRCNSVSSGGYDAALVNLCKLLRMSASR